MSEKFWPVGNEYVNVTRDFPASSITKHWRSKVCKRVLIGCEGGDFEFIVWGTDESQSNPENWNELIQIASLAQRTLCRKASTGEEWRLTGNGLL